MNRKLALSVLIVGSMAVATWWSRQHPTLAVAELLLLHLFFLVDLLIRPPVAGIDQDSPRHVRMSKAYMAVLVYLPLLVPAWGYGPAYAQAVGASLTVLGAMLTIWGRSALGRMGTETLTIVPGQRLHKSGPYRFVRHPIYCGFSVAFLGHQVAFTSPPGLLVWLLFMVHIIHRRIRREEDMLLEHFGAQYREYVRTTWRMFPCLY